MREELKEPQGMNIALSDIDLIIRGLTKKLRGVMIMIKISLLGLLIISLIMICNLSVSTNSLVIKGIKVIEVEDGDSLWEIVDKIDGHNSVNTHKLIYLIKDMNELNSAIIHPGQTLKIPIIKDMEVGK